MEAIRIVRPMSLLRSLVFSAVPALLMLFIFWYVMPFLDLLGHRLFFTYLLGIGVPSAFLIVAAYSFYRRDGYARSLEGFKDRMRLRRMSTNEWLMAAALSLYLYLTNELLQFTTPWVESVVPVPKLVDRMYAQDAGYFMEVGLKGNWWILPALLLFVGINVLGEELWWRGYILPRQEAALRDFAWILNGILSNCFYLFMIWDFIALLPGSFALAFIAQRLRNTLLCVIAHFAANLPWLLPVAANIF